MVPGDAATGAGPRESAPAGTDAVARARPGSPAGTRSRESAAADLRPSPPDSGRLIAALAADAAEAAGRLAPAGSVPAPRTAPEVLADRSDATVVRVGGAVAKAHAPGTDPDALAVRLAVAAHPRLRGVLLRPLGEPAERSARSRPDPARPVSVWPYGQPVDPGDPDSAPWEAAGVLLARLHAVPPAELPGPLPPMRGPAKAARAMARLRAAPDSPEAAVVRRAWDRLPAWARGEEAYEGRGALCHGDWHLGQLVRHPAPDGDWQLIDIDDLGAGEPAWDLARPAMWFAAGLLAPEVWARFLGAYRGAGGIAVPALGDPWAVLDVPARTLAVQSAAIAVAKAALGERPLDGTGFELLATCRRIAQLE